MEAGSSGIEQAERVPIPEKSAGRKRPSLDIRLSMYADVQELRKSTPSCSKIRLELQKKYGVTLAVDTVRSWATGRRTPASAGHVFIPRARPDLAYVIGVEAGDGSLNVRPDNYQYKIRLKAVDVEFVEAFNHAMANLLNCPRNRLWKGKTERETYVDYGSYLLHKFLLQPFDTFKPFIEHDEQCVTAFLRGFFDSEGHVTVNGIVNGSNTDLNLLRYVQFLLAKYFGIVARGPYLGTRKGSILTRRGRSYRRNSDCYSIIISKGQLEKFQQNVGLTIRRKRLRIERVLAVRVSRTPRSRQIRTKH